METRVKQRGFNKENDTSFLSRDSLPQDVLLLSWTMYKLLHRECGLSLESCSPQHSPQRGRKLLEAWGVPPQTGLSGPPHQAPATTASL